MSENSEKLWLQFPKVQADFLFCPKMFGFIALNGLVIKQIINCQFIFSLSANRLNN